MPEEIEITPQREGAPEQEIIDDSVPSIDADVSETSDESLDGNRLVVTAEEGNWKLLEEIKQILEDRLLYDSVKEKAFDKLYEEMKRQKELSDILDRNIKPIISDLLLFHDSLQEFYRLLIDEDLKKACGFRLKDLLEILYRQDIIPMDSNLAFDSKTHKAVKVINSTNMDDEKRIVAIERIGFLWRDKVLRPQEVIINKYSETITNLEEPGENKNV